jgi:RNA polymerase sigma-70 factor (ECF subfamily)
MLRAEEDALAEEFEAHRAHLLGLGYRMLGSIGEAEDAVQEAWLRFRRADRASIRDPRAFLSRVVARLCLEAMRAARTRRAAYVGPWLPDPVVDPALSEGTAGELAADLSTGLMLALERLSPLERAAFLLHDVFDLGFDELAAVLGRSEAACRQLAARARAHVRAARPRFELPDDGGAAILQAFLEAARSGDPRRLAALLAEDVELHTDGGGRRRAALRVIVGRDRVARGIAGILRKFAEPVVETRPLRIGGLPGVLTRFADGGLQTTALGIVGERICAIYVVRNPEKLRHLGDGAGGAP